MPYNIHMLKMSKNYFINNTYIIVDEATNYAAVVDPAWDLKLLLSKLNELNINKLIILLTHSHFDHVNLVKPLIKKFAPEIYIHKKEADFYKYKNKNLICFEHLDQIILGKTRISALHTPGHTVGSACYLFQNDIFTGDTIFIEGCGICDCYGGSTVEMFNTIQYIKKLLPSSVKVYPGHTYISEPGMPIINLLENNIYFHIEDYDTFVKFRMRDTQNNIMTFK